MNDEKTKVFQRAKQGQKPGMQKRAMKCEKPNAVKRAKGRK